MRRTLAALLASGCLLLACGDDPDDVPTGDADSEADTGTEGNRDTTTCAADEGGAASAETIEPGGDDPAGSTEDQESCTPGNDGDGSVGDGDVESGGTPGAGSPTDGGGTP